MSENLSKQVLYRAKHRGCKETDFLIGKFVEEKLANFSPEFLQLLAKFLCEDDLLIYDWILSKETPPSQYLQAVAAIREFHKI